MFALGALHPCRSNSGGWHWTRDGERIASISYQASLGDDSGALRLDYSCGRDSVRRSVTCSIPLSSRPLPYGGRYWYMHCPYTGRRARKLYKFSGVDQFAHRTAIRPLPTYAIQRESGYGRVNAQRWALRRKMGDQFSDLFGEPCKPKWMRWRTYQRYAERDAELSAREDCFLSPWLLRLLALETGS